VATSDFGGRSANASSAGSKPAMSRRPQFQMLLFRPSSLRSPRTATRRLSVHRKMPAAAAIGRKMWRFRSLIIQGRCGTLAATERFIAIIPMRKVTP
jgi:hypothetical protein